jgi:hypothetical protein
VSPAPTRGEGDDLLNDDVRSAKLTERRNAHRDAAARHLQSYEQLAGVSFLPTERLVERMAVEMEAAAAREIRRQRRGHGAPRRPKAPGPIAA